MRSSFISFVVLSLAACGSPSAEDHKPDARLVDGPPGKTDAATDSALPFTPAQLSGLVLWLDAGQNVATSQSKVTAWTDNSTNSNNAAQTNAAMQPTLVTGVIGGKPVVRFNGSVALQITDSATLQWGTDDFTLAVVASYTNSTSASPPYGMVLAKQTATSPYTGPSVWGNFVFPSLSSKFALQLQDTAGNFVQTSAQAQNDGTARLYVARRSGGTNLEMRVNGVTSGAETQSTNVNISAAGRPLFIGGAIGASVTQGLTGDIAEIVAVRGAMSSADLTKLETYLKTKYGL